MPSPLRLFEYTIDSFVFVTGIISRINIKSVVGTIWLAFTKYYANFNLVCIHNHEEIEGKREQRESQGSC